MALLINNAGYGALGPLAELPMNSCAFKFETNVFGIVALVQALLPDMVRQRSGRIVNISSVSGVLTTPFAGAYCATKAAVHALSDSLRMELQPFGIEVITVQPGGVASQFIATAANHFQHFLRPAFETFGKTESSPGVSSSELHATSETLGRP